MSISSNTKKESPYATACRLGQLSLKELSEHLDDLTLYHLYIISNSSNIRESTLFFMLQSFRKKKENLNFKLRIKRLEQTVKSLESFHHEIKKDCN